MNTVDFLDGIRVKHGLRSDYMVAKLLGVSTQNVSHWRSGSRTMGPDACLKVAELLSIKPEFVLASVAAERAQGPEERSAWERAAAALAACLVAAVGLVTPPPAEAAAPAAGQCILCKSRRGRRGPMAARLLPFIRYFRAPILRDVRTTRG
jgi:DNA-binding transcriptional regulator YdaS (Cro superfamily)